MNNQSKNKEASPGGKKKEKGKGKKKKTTKPHALPQKHTATIGRKILELAPVATPCAAGDHMYEAAILSSNWSELRTGWISAHIFSAFTLSPDFCGFKLHS